MLPTFRLTPKIRRNRPARQTFKSSLRKLFSTQQRFHSLAPKSYTNDKHLFWRVYARNSVGKWRQQATCAARNENTRKIEKIRRTQPQSMSLRALAASSVKDTEKTRNLHVWTRSENEINIICVQIAENQKEKSGKSCVKHSEIKVYKNMCAKAATMATALAINGPRCD